MQEAYLLLNANAGDEDVLLRSIRQIPAVHNVVGVYGVYDILVQLRARHKSEVEKAASKIRQLQAVKATFTMPVIQN